MKGIVNYPNIDTTDPANYPNGVPTDRTSGSAGTPVNMLTNQDLQLYFDKMLRMNGISANGDFDNESNGYQSIEALLLTINATVAPVMEYIIGGAYDASAVYVLTGLSDRTENGFVFYDGNIYYVTGNTGPICGGGNVFVLNTDANNYDSSTFAMSISCASSGSGVVDFSDLTRNFNTGEWLTTGLTYETGWVTGSIVGQPAFAYRKDVLPGGGGIVTLRGSIRNNLGASALGIMVTLPAGYRPTTDYNVFSAYTSSTASTVEHLTAVRIDSDGTVRTLELISSTAAVALTMSFHTD